MTARRLLAWALAGLVLGTVAAVALDALADAPRLKAIVGLTVAGFAAGAVVGSHA